MQNYSLSSAGGSVDTRFSGRLGKELRLERRRHKPNCGTSREELPHSATPLFTIIERPFVHVHTDKLIGQLRVHIARKLQRVVQSCFAVFECVADAFANHTANL